MRCFICKMEPRGKARVTFVYNAAGTRVGFDWICERCVIRGSRKD